MGDPGKGNTFSRYSGPGLLHKINVAKDAQLTITVYRRSPSYNFLLFFRGTPKLRARCPGAFKKCLVNSMTTWSSSAYRTAVTPMATYPGVGVGNTEDEIVFVGVQADRTPNDGYYLMYQVCKQGGNGAWGKKNGALCPIHGF